MTIHYIFLVTFVFNVLYVLAIKKYWRKGKMSFWVVFGVTWLLDALTMFLYQTVFFGSSAILIVVLIAFLPALILALGVQKNYPRVL